jgi:hypothetical protein
MSSPRIASVLLVVLICACSPQSPSDAYLIPDDELHAVEEKAHKGDLSAVHQLIDHYDSYSGGEQSAALWKKKALELSDPAQLYNEAAVLATRAKRESGAKKKEDLSAALVYAKKSLAAKDQASTRELIADIEEKIAQSD